jgi:hypothetical protein
MDRTPKILPTYYKSLGTKIFRDTTALPFAEGGPIEGDPINWNRPKLSAERIAAIKAMHGDTVFGNVNPNDLLLYELNKDLIDNAGDFKGFLDSSVKPPSYYTDEKVTRDIKQRMMLQNYGLDTKTGNYMRIPDEVLAAMQEPEIDFESIPPGPPGKIDIPKRELIISAKEELPSYQMPGYLKQYEFPSVGWRTPLGAKAVQKLTGYDREAIEGTYDEEGNYIPGEIENAQEQNRPIQFQGASSLKDVFAQREYQRALEEQAAAKAQTNSFADGGPLNDRNIKGDLLQSVYASALGRYYGNGGKFLTAGGEYHKIYKSAEGDIMVNHPQEDKGQWDTINLTEKSDANTIADGVQATKQWHQDNPNSYANGGQLKPDYSLPEDSFQQGGRGLKNSVYASSMGQYPAPYAMGGAMNQYPDGGAIYTYAGRPGSFYQKDSEGNWLISNKGTGGQYVPVDDPSGQRTAILNKGAVVTMANPTTSKYDNVVPSYGKSPMVQSVAGRTEAERQPVQDAIAGQQFAQNMEQDYAAATKDQLPQHEQPLDMMDYAWQGAMGAPMALKGLQAVSALKIPFTEMSLGTAANVAGGIHGATQIPNRVQDWQDVAAGDKTWQEATAKTIGTGLEVGAGALEGINAVNMYKFNPAGTSLERGQVANTVYPQVITSPTTGLKQYGSTTLIPNYGPKAPAGLIRSNNSTYSDAALLPIEQQPYKLTAAQMEARNPAELNAFYKMRATERTADKLLKRQADNKTYYDLEGNTIKTPEDNYQLGGMLNHKYPDGGVLGATSNLVPTNPIPEGPVIPDGQATRDFYTNWYSKRTLPFDEIGNSKYEKVMKSILPAYNPESQLLNEINTNKVPYEINPSLAKNNAAGALVYNKKGNPEKIELNPSIMQNPAELNATMTHEERTRIMAPYADKVLPAEQMIINPSIKTFEEGWGNLDKAEQNAAADFYDYTTSPQEDNIQSMLFEIRQKKNLQPNQTITDEDIQNWKLEAEQNGALDRNNPNYDNALDSLFKLSKDNSSMKNLFNYIASNNTPKANNINPFPTYGGNFT